MKRAYLIALTAALGTLNVASAAWQKLPDTGVPPVNLASGLIVGTKTVSTSGISNSQALVADDPAQLADLSAGSSSAVIDIGDQTLVEFVSFLNEGGLGKVSVAASINNKDWVALSQLPFDSTTRLVELNFAGIQAKYLKLSFELSKASSISSVKLLGVSQPPDYYTSEVKKQDKTSKINTTAGASYSKRVYTFPTSTSYGKLENGQGSYEFPKTNEKYRTTIYDLGDIQTLKKFSVAYSNVPTRVEIFTFEQLPEKKDWRGKTTFDPSILDSIKPVAVGEDASGVGRLNINASQPVTAKYVVMRFEPNYSKRVSGLSAEWQSMVSAALIPFSGVANQLGILDLSSIWHPVAAEASGGFVVFNVSMSPGGTSVKVYISKSAVAKVQQQMGPGTTATQAINAILLKAGMEIVGETQPGNNNGTKSKETVGDPALSNALSGFGLSAYRNGGSGGIGGGSGGGSGSNPSSSSSGSSRPIVIISNTVAPTTP